MEEQPPLELLGAIGGAAGTIPLLQVARDLAARLFALPVLPGAERRAADIKAATCLEAAVFLLAIPAAALIFGHVLPRLLRRRSVSPALSGSPGAAFALSAVLWRLDAAPLLSLAAGMLSAAVLAAALFLLGDRPVLRRLLEEPNRSAFVTIAAACLAWGLAARSARLRESVTAADLGGILLLAAALLSLLVFRKTQRGRRSEA